MYASISGLYCSTELNIKLVGGTNYITEFALCRHFNLTPGTVQLQKSFYDEKEEILMEVPICKSKDGNFYQLDASMGNSYRVFGEKFFQQESAQPQTPASGIKEEVTKSTSLNTKYNVCELKEKAGEIQVVSVTKLFAQLPSKSKLKEGYVICEHIMQVDELPSSYDGDIFFELPSLQPGQTEMSGMEQKYDGHMWNEYCTSNVVGFPGVVRISRCAGHMKCINNSCPYYIKNGVANEVQWKGKLHKPITRGAVTDVYGTLACLHCKLQPLCLNSCPAIIYYCIPRKQDVIYTRGCLHLGSHKHPVEQGMVRKAMDDVMKRVKEKALQEPNTGQRLIQMRVARDIINDTLLHEKVQNGVLMNDEEFDAVVSALEPLSEKRRLNRWIREARALEGPQGDTLDSVLYLKNRCSYEFFHGMIFPGQLQDVTFDRVHIFKMSTMGACSGVDLINKMRPTGELHQFWVCFDHVKRIRGWTTMAAHVYNPFVQELQTIAICDFKVEDTNAQVEFWRMLNEVMEKKGFPPAEFAGFMADEAQANWRAVRTVFNGGPENVMHGRERSCLFHWEQSMVVHTKNCILSSSQEEHKLLCRRWRSAATKELAEKEREHLIGWWHAGHAIPQEIPTLQTWMSWWSNRVAHWGDWMMQVLDGDVNIGTPRTNLAESKHGSWLAGEGYKEQIGLLNAQTSDLSNSILQTVKYTAYLKGHHIGTGPALEQLRSRSLSSSIGKSTSKKLVDLTGAVMKEIDLDVEISDKFSGDHRTIRRKVPPSRRGLLGSNDSHRPEYKYINIPQKRGGNIKKNLSDIMDLVEEKVLSAIQEWEVHDTTWAIRRTMPGSRVRCSAYIDEKKGKCHEFINRSFSKNNPGQIAPCFRGRRENAHGISQQMFWFCNSEVTHSWTPLKSIQEVPGHAPGIWKVAKGTNLTKIEEDMLIKSGFRLDTTINVRNDVEQQSSPKELSACRPKSRDGKPIRYRWCISKECKDRISRARTMVAKIIKRVVLLELEDMLFYIETSESVKKGVVYVVQISEYPKCSCLDFVERSSKTTTYGPCKHMYFVYICILGLDPFANMEIHQVALSKRELHSILSREHLL